VRCGGHLVSIEKHCGASAIWKSTYNERLAQALRLPLGSGRPLQALLRGSGATRNGKSQHYEVDSGRVNKWRRRLCELQHSSRKKRRPGIVRFAVLLDVGLCSNSNITITQV
jgi:hypothetical protein